MKQQLANVLNAATYVVMALLLCALLFHLAGQPAGSMLWSILDSAFLRANAFEQSLRWALPLFITAVGIGVCFRCGFFNIGAQGQFYVGSICAAYAAHWLNGAPSLLVIPACVLAAMLGGALWAFWPGLLRVRWGTDEVITTLMANFIAGLMLTYVTGGPLKNPAGTGQQTSTAPIDLAYRISTSTGVSPLIIGIAAVVGLAIWFLNNRTGFGILSRLAGQNAVMVQWQGATTRMLGLTSFLIAGALAGLAGSIEFLGPDGRLSNGFLPTHGFTAILIALVAGFSVIGSAIAAVLFGGLAAAALYLPIMAGLPASAVDLINATIAIFITARTRLFDWFLQSKEPGR
jgi:general nucleoside transport system permease protein